MPINKNLNAAGAIINPATEDTLALMKTQLDNLAGEDFATQTTLALMKTALDNIKTQTDKLKFTGDYLKTTVA